MMSGSWYKVPAALFNDQTMSRADIAVFAYIADRIKGKEQAVPIAAVMKACELSKSTALRCIEHLSERGYIAATKRAGKSTLYKQLLIPIGNGRASRELERDEFDASKYEFVINSFADEIKEA